MKVLVTGAGGHIGGAAARHLAAAGHEVIATVRHPGISLHGMVQVVVDFAADFDAVLSPVMHGCEAVVHCAADLSNDMTSLLPTRVNALSTHALLLLAARFGVRRFVHISGFHVIGATQQTPITEDHPCRPSGVYAASKLYAEHLVDTIREAGGMSGVSLRVSSPVGPGLKRKRLFSICADAAAAGTPIRLHGQGGRCQDFVDVRDVARGIEAAIGRGVEGIVNLASGRPVSNRELAQACIDALGSASTIEWSGEADMDEQVRWEISIDRARRHLKFTPRFSLTDSIRDYCAWKATEG